MVQWRKGPPLDPAVLGRAEALRQGGDRPRPGLGGRLPRPPLRGLRGGRRWPRTLVWLAAVGRAGRRPGGPRSWSSTSSRSRRLAVILGGAASGNPLGAVGRQPRHEADARLRAAVRDRPPRRGVPGADRGRARPCTRGPSRSPGLVEFQDAHGCFLGQPSGILAFLVALLCAQAKLGLRPLRPRRGGVRDRRGRAARVQRGRPRDVQADPGRAPRHPPGAPGHRLLGRDRTSRSPACWPSSARSS